MTTQRTLGLRNNGHRVDLVQRNDSSRPVLGTASPQDGGTARRGDVQQQWDHCRTSPRAPQLATIDEVLQQRTQTILYYQVGPETRERLNGGVQLAASRKPGEITEHVVLSAIQLDI